jgi:hypothetical protein
MAGSPPPIASGTVVDRGASIVAVLWVEAVIASIFITLRFLSRNIGKTIGLDDWTMLVATVWFHAPIHLYHPAEPRSDLRYSMRLYGNVDEFTRRLPPRLAHAPTKHPHSRARLVHLSNHLDHWYF